MAWLYRNSEVVGGPENTEKCCGVMVGHTLLFQRHPAPRAADMCFLINREMDFVSSVGISWCFGIAGVLNPAWGTTPDGGCKKKKKKKSGGDLNNRTREDR